MQESSHQVSPRSHLISKNVIQRNVKHTQSQDHSGPTVTTTRVSATSQANSQKVNTSCSQKRQGSDGAGYEAGIRVGTLDKSSPVSTHNKYEVLQQDDGVVLRHSERTLAETPSDLKSTDNHDSQGRSTAKRLKNDNVTPM